MAQVIQTKVSYKDIEAIHKIIHDHQNVIMDECKDIVITFTDVEGYGIKVSEFTKLNMCVFPSHANGNTISGALGDNPPTRMRGAYFPHKHIDSEETAKLIATVARRAKLCSKRNRVRVSA